jgi:hypothetical protein
MNAFNRVSIVSQHPVRNKDQGNRDHGSKDKETKPE